MICSYKNPVKKFVLVCIWTLISITTISSQNVGVNTISPLTSFHVDLGSSHSNGILFTGMEPEGGTFPSLGAGRRFMFYPGKGAIRAGMVEGTHWDHAQVGTLSAAFGFNTIARGPGSFATGDDTQAKGFISTTFGSGTIAKGYSSVVMGMFNDSLITGADQDFALPSTPLLMVGNGDGNGTRHTTMAVFKNGNFFLKNPVAMLADPGSIEPPVSGPGTRLLWMPKKSAFRLGTVHNNDWDADSIGTWSTGIGYSTKAKGQFSLALGLQTTASGLTSTAMGYATKASGENAISTGSVTTASGSVSTALGYGTIASGPTSTAMGYATKASGENAIAMGSVTVASGANSTSIGFDTYARSYGSVAMGQWNDSIQLSNKTSWLGEDPLLILGNGTSTDNRHNAMVVYKNGNMVLKNPVAFYYNKLPDPYPIPVSGEGTRMMWLPEISGFRVGTVSDTAWDAANIGIGSFGSGINSMASGNGSTATGVDTKASGLTSTAMGYGTIASGESSMSFGSETTAKGINSTSFGYKTYARSYGSVTMGRYNDSIYFSNPTEWMDADPLLILGNGISDVEPHNTMVVYKNGNIISKSLQGVSVDPGILPIPIQGGGTRMMWLPEKSAFRAGTVVSTQWDAELIGTWSFGFGVNNVASGIGSIVLGKSSNVLGIHSVCLGSFNDVIGDYAAAIGSSNTAALVGSIALGSSCKANNNYSTAIGWSSIANGVGAVSIGLGNNAKGFSSVVVGMYNDSILNVNQNAIDPITPLFIVGNGDGAGAGQRKNAMVVRKDGRVGIGTNTPATQLTVIGAAGNPSIPDNTSTGIFRIGLNASDAVDIGKMDVPPFSGWIQAGINGELADPLSLQPAGGKVGIGTASPATSAVLDVASTNKGFLPPRMTFDNRNSIASPAAGLMIWCSTCGVYGQLQIFNGIFWANMTGSPAVGLPAVGVRDGGGIIAYILQPGDPGYVAGEVHGLITSLPDHQIIGIDYGCQGTNIPGAEGTDIGTGNQNTLDIVSGCAGSNVAARACADLFSQGYDDWYLPSIDELNQLYLNRIAIGGFNLGNNYWSSSESNSTQAMKLDFSTGSQANQNKDFGFDVRAVRSF